MSWKVRRNVGLIVTILFVILAMICAPAQTHSHYPSAFADGGPLPQFDGATRGGQAVKEVCIRIESVGKGKNPDIRFTLSLDNVPSNDPADQNIGTVGKALERLESLLQDNRDSVAVTVYAHPHVQAGVLLSILEAMDKPAFRNKTATKIYYGVIDKP
jgi:hypothetical protein